MRVSFLVIVAAIATLAIAAPSVLAEASGSCPYHANGDGAIAPEKWHRRAMPDDYSGGLKEFSVVYTDRALNHMSAPFIEVMNDLNTPQGRLQRRGDRHPPRIRHVRHGGCGATVRARREGARTSSEEGKKKCPSVTAHLIFPLSRYFCTSPSAASVRLRA